MLCIGCSSVVASRKKEMEAADPSKKAKRKLLIGYRHGESEANPEREREESAQRLCVISLDSGGWCALCHHSLTITARRRDRNLGSCKRSHL